MDKQLLECGHTQPAKPGAGATWCPICNEIALVVEVPEPVQAGTAAALARTNR
jgi:hypothetical protein